MNVTQYITQYFTKQHLQSAALAVGLAITPIAALAAEAPTKLVVASFGGKLDQVYKALFTDFEKQHNITIQWVPGTAPGNVAKLAATAQSPEYDLVLFDNINQRVASQQGLLAPIDEQVVKQWGDLQKWAQAKGKDGVAVGGFVTGIYYRKDIFAEKGWPEPTSWGDLANPQFCNSLGLERASQVYTLNAVVMLADAKLDNIDKGIDRFVQLAKCTPVLEASAAKHEEKILLGEYLIGVNSSIRALPLTPRIKGLTFVIPKEGAVTSSTMVSPVKNGPNPTGAQAFINWFINPDVQQKLMNELFYIPVNRQVTVPAELHELGIPDQATLAKLPVIDDDVIVENRRNWAVKLEQKLNN